MTVKSQLRRGNDRNQMLQQPQVKGCQRQATELLLTAYTERRLPTHGRSD